jgi:antigen flippase
VSRAVTLTLITRAIQIASGFVGAVVTARFLGPEARGQYFFVVTMTLLVVQFANLGLHASNTYHVAQDERLLGPLVANSAWASLVLGGGGAFLAVVVLRLSDWFPTTRPSLLWFSVALAPAILFFMLGTNLLVGANRIGTFNLFELFANLLVIAALLMAGLAAFGVKGFLAAGTAAWTAASVALLLFLAGAAEARLTFRPLVLKATIRYAMKAYLISALAFLVLRGNVFVLQRFYGANEVGYYSVAAQVADALAILPTSVALILFPRLIRSGGNRWAETIRSCAIVGAILLVVCGFVGLVAGEFMRVAFGPAFEPAAGILRWMLPGVLAIGLTTLLSQYLAAIGLPRATIVIWAVAVAVVLGLGRLFIPPHAGAGAAVALSVTYGLVFIAILGLAYHYRERAEEEREDVAVRGGATGREMPELPAS